MRNVRRLGWLGPLIVVVTLAFFTGGPANAGKSSDPLPVSNALSLSEDVAFDGTNYLAVWTQYTGTASGKPEIYGATIDGAGTQKHIIGAISSDVDGKADDTPAVTWNGSHYLVVWSQSFGDGDSDILGRRIDTSGSVVGNIFKIATPGNFQLTPTVTASGSTFLAAWVDDRTGNGDIYGGRITDAGALLDGDGGVVLANNAKAEHEPDVAGSSSGFYLVYELQFSDSDVDVYGRSVSSTLALGTVTPLAAGSDVEENGTVASDGSQFLAVWGDAQSTTNAVDIQGTRIQNGAPVGSFITVSSAPAGQSEPDIAFNGTFLTVWRDSRNGHSSVYGTRISTAGVVQETDGFAIWDNTGTGGGTRPAVSPGKGGQKWGVVYDNALTEGVFFRTASSK